MRNLHTCICSLIFLAMAHTALASNQQEAFRYEIELQVPAGQRKLLEDNLDIYRWREGERMNEAQLQRLVRLAPEQIRNLLSTDGYYSPRIETGLKLRGGQWLASLTVYPGDPVRVANTDLRVTGRINDNPEQANARLKKLQEDWGLPAGTVFRHDDWESAKRNALKLLLLEGYPAASIADSHATVNQDSRTVELHITVESGPFFTFGKLDIQGLQRYPASLIERLSLIIPGEPYSQNKLLELQSNLQNSPYFSSATVKVDTNPDQPTSVPILVEVTENPARKLGLGVGMSTDTGARGLLDYRDLNIFDRAWQLGGTFKLEQKRQSISSTLQFPMAAAGFRDSINVLFERADIEGEVTQKTVIGPKRTFASGKTETAFGVRYFIEKQEIKGGEISRRYTLSPSYSWTLRDVDNLLYPTGGYMVNVSVDIASRSLLSDQDFIRGYGRGAYFLSISTHDQLILHSELGIVTANSRNDIPSDFLFRTGGDQTVRGYAYQSLGVAEGNAVVGGRYLGIVSAEYVHWLSDTWGAAVFVDAGNATDTLDNPTPVYGYGTGARWKTPIGPLNFDLAYGHEVRKMRIHFSMGFNF